MYKGLTHHGVKSDVQEGIRLKAMIFISKLKGLITNDYFQLHAFPGRGKQMFHPFREKAF